MSSEPDPHTPTVPIAQRRAEQRRALLERMSEQGMAIAERLTMRSVAPEIGGDILQHAEMFAKIARGVRLAIMLETKLDGQILAFRKGDLTALDEPAPRAPAGKARDPGRPPREVVDAEQGPDRDDELFEGPEYDRLPTGGFRSWVEVICDDLGLDPDWSCWSDEEGFIHDDGRPVTEWPVRKERTSSLTRSGEGGLAASGREPGGGTAPRLESWGAVDQDQRDTARDPPTPLPPEGGSRPSPLRGREES